MPGEGDLQDPQAKVKSEVEEGEGEGHESIHRNKDVPEVPSGHTRRWTGGERERV